MTVFVKILDIRLVFEKIINIIENELNAKGFNLKHNYYWSCFDKYQIMHEPSGAGQLHDDYEFLEPLLQEKDQRFPLMLIHLAPILEYMASEVDWRSSSFTQKNEDDKFIEISNLKYFFNGILNHIQYQLNTKGFYLNDCKYHYASNRYQMHLDPSYITKRIHDDHEVINKILHEKESASPSALMHLAQILYYMATEVNWYEDHLPPQAGLA